MRVIAQSTLGDMVEFEADAKLTQSDVGFLRLGSGGVTAKSGTSVAGAVTFNQPSGTITTEALTTAALLTYTLTITDSKIAASDMVLVSVGNGSNSAGTPDFANVTPSAGSMVITVRNAHATAAFNGTLKVSFILIKV